MKKPNILTLIVFTVSLSAAGSSYAQSLTETDPFVPDNPAFYDLDIYPEPKTNPDLNIKYKVENDVDFEDPDDDPTDKLQKSRRLKASFKPSEKVSARFSGDFSTDNQAWYEEDQDKRSDFNLWEMYIRLDDVAVEGTSVRVGRQRIKDKRQWVLDERLDGIRVKYDHKEFSVDTSVTREDMLDLNTQEDINEDPVYNYMVRTGRDITDDIEVSAYTVFRDDTTADDDDHLTVGLHTSGDVTEHAEFWVEAAHSRSKRDSGWRQGAAFDAGVILKPGTKLDPSVTLAYAHSTRDFRQTGLQDNQAKLGGVTTVNYYGEVLDPELSNLSVATAGVGIRPTKESSVDVLFHNYRLTDGSGPLRGEDIEADTNGESGDLGNGVDVVFGLKKYKALELKLTLGYFMPGAALEDNDDVFLSLLEIEYDL